jgi:hypothetical protein
MADFNKKFIMQTDASGIALGQCYCRKYSVLDSQLLMHPKR